jgi:thymidylate synthase
LKSFLIIGTKDCDLKFVSLKEDDDQFYQELEIGKLSLYKIYFTSMYGQEFSNGVILKEGKLYKIAGIGIRKKFGELIKDYGELYDKWMNPDEYKIDQFQELVGLYNDHFNN